MPMTGQFAISISLSTEHTENQHDTPQIKTNINPNSHHTVRVYELLYLYGLRESEVGKVREMDANQRKQSKDKQQQITTGSGGL